MGTLIAETDIRGRLGTYTFSLYDLTDTVTPLDTFSIDADVSIQWGESGRDYPEQVLRSYSRITVREGAAQLKDVFTGNYNLFNFPVRINGPGVDWLGFPEPSERIQPFSTRTSPVSLALTLVDGFQGAKTPLQIRNLLGASTLIDLLQSNFQQGPDSLDGLSFTDNHLGRYDGVFEDKTSTAYDATDRNPGAGTAVNGATRYDQCVNLLRLMRARVYRSLSEGLIAAHALRETGQGLDYGQEDAGSVITVSRSASIVSITTNDVLGRLDDAFTAIADAGTVEVDLSDYTGLAVDENQQNTIDISRLDGDYNLCRGGVVTITDDNSGLGEVVDEILFERGRPELEGSSGTVDTFTADIGPVDPTADLGIVVDWNVVDRPGAGSSSLEVEIDYGSGTVASEADGRNNFTLVGPIDSTDKDISVRFIMGGVDVYPRVRYVTTDGRVVETFVAAEDNRTLEVVEVEPANMPVIENDAGIVGPETTALRFLPGRDTSLTGDGSTAASIDVNQGFLVQAQLEALYRPFGLLSLQTEVDGLHGPETALIAEAPDGTDRLFVCGQGRTVNLTTGTTRVNDIEIPTDLLPGGTIPSPS